MKLLIIADDFTGALDTGVQFAACGVQTNVVVGAKVDFAAAEVDVLVVDTETRHLSAEEAYQTVARLSASAKDAGVDYIYKKTDSALRGNIGAELTALLDASGQDRLPFLPAFPQMNRVTVGGIHYIDDVPVTESPFGVDPFEPVRHSAVTELLAEQSEMPAYSLSPLTAEQSLPQQKGILVFDARSVEELRQTGSYLHKQGELHIMAGCAGFAGVLPQLLGMADKSPRPVPQLDPRLLVVCGSVNSITVSQLEEAQKNGFLHLHLSPEQKLEEGHWQSPAGQREFEQISECLMNHPLCIIDSNDEGGNEQTARYASERNLQIEDVRVGIAHSIGYLVGELFTSPALGTLLITGGDTLLQCMECVGIHELEPVCELEKGVVLSKFTYKGCSRYVISKSGGFGQESLLIDLARQLQEQKNEI